MAREIKTTLALDGEKEFKKGLAEAQSHMRVLASESKAVTASFNTNRGSVDALTAKNRVLNQQIQQQQQIVKALKQAVVDSTSAYGENSKTTDGYKIKLNNASAALENMKGELGKNENALSDMAAAEDTAGNQAAKMGKDLKKSESQTKSFGSSIKEFAKSSLGNFLSIAAVTATLKKAFQDLWKTIKDSAKAADDLGTLSKQTGVATDTLQKMNYAAAGLDVETSVITDSLKKLSKNMYMASVDTKLQKDAFEALGIEYEDGNGKLRDNQDVFYEMLDTLGKMTNETERDALAMMLMGKSAQDLNPLIKAGGGALKAYGEEAQSVGAIVDDLALASLATLNDKMEENATVAKAQAAKMTAVMGTEALTIDGLINKIKNAFTTLEYESYHFGVRMSGASEDTVESFDKLKEGAFAAGLSVDDYIAKYNELAYVLLIQGVPASEAFDQAMLLTAQGMDVATYATQQMSDAQAGYDATVSAALENYDALAKEYSINVQATADTYLSAMGGIFGGFPEKVKQSADQMLEELRAQDVGMREWSDNLASLAARGVDAGIVDKLRSLGPAAAGQVATMNSMSDDKLKETVTLMQTNMDNAVAAAQTAWAPLKDDVEAALAVVNTSVSDEYTGMYEAAKTFGSGLADGIDATALLASSSAYQSAKKALAAAKRALGSTQPTSNLGVIRPYGTGGIVTTPQLALIGDEDEVIIPLNNTKRSMDLLAYANTAMQSFAASAQTDTPAFSRALPGSSGNVNHAHSGTIRVEGVNNKGQFEAVYDMLVDKIMMEARV